MTLAVAHGRPSDRTMIGQPGDEAIGCMMGVRETVRAHVDAEESVT